MKRCMGVCRFLRQPGGAEKTGRRAPLPSRSAAGVGAQVALKRGPSLRKGEKSHIETIARKQVMRGHH